MIMVLSMYYHLLQCEQVADDLLMLREQRRHTVRNCLDTLHSYSTIVSHVSLDIKYSYHGLNNASFPSTLTDTWHIYSNNLAINNCSSH